MCVISLYGLDVSLVYTALMCVICLYVLDVGH